MSAWVTGHNLTGYLPESDTHAYSEWKDARDVLIANMQEYADRDDEAAYDHLSATARREDYPDFENSGYGDDEPSMRAQVDAVLKDDGPQEGQNFGAIIEDNDERNITFWLWWEEDRWPDDWHWQWCANDLDISTHFYAEDDAAEARLWVEDGTLIVALERQNDGWHVSGSDSYHWTEDARTFRKPTDWTMPKA